MRNSEHKLTTRDKSCIINFMLYRSYLNVTKAFGLSIASKAPKGHCLLQKF